MFRKILSLLLVCCMVMGSTAPLVRAEETCSHSFDIYGNCTLCGYVCMHQWDENSWCDLCENTCTHDYVDSVCTICGVPCGHSMVNGTCQFCGMTCDHDNHTTDGVCTNCGDTVNHSYVDGICTVCGGADPDYVKPVVDYYLVGCINGADYGCEGDWENLGEYKFVDGSLTATFDADSYVFLKTGDNANWYMAESYVTGTSGTFYNTSTGTTEKMLVPGGREIVFTLVENQDGSLTLSYVAAHVHVYDAVVTAPTCTEGGYTTYTCSCGDSYVADQVPATGHSFADGTCTGCGASDTNESEPDTIVAPTLTGKSFTLSFEDEILVNFYYVISDTTNVVEQGMLVFNTNPATADISEAADVYAGSTYVPANGRYLNTTTGIPAKMMGDSRYYAAYAKLSNGSYVYSALHEYSPKKYAMNMLGKSTTSDKQKALCVAMLNYGAAAQSYFGYNTDNLMNAELTDAQRALVIDYDASLFTGAVAASAGKIGQFAATSTGFQKKSATVSFEGAFSINYYFTPDVAVSGDMTLYYWFPEDYATAATLTVQNASGSMTMVPGSDGRYWGQVSGIPAKMLDETYYVAAVYTDAEGNTCCTGVIAYSLSKYCMNNASGAMGELAQNTAMYGYYAKLFFTA